MTTSDLLEALGYPDSAGFASAAEVGAAPEHAHIFRRAIHTCRLVGTFSLTPSRQKKTLERTPVVVVAEASSDTEADEIHRRVWNQNVTPFLLVQTPEHVRLYSGFEYAPRSKNGAANQAGLLDGLIEFEDVLRKLSDFRASAIEDGQLWRAWGDRVRPESRVDWKLLANLEELGKRLHADNLKRSTAHALIGKFVYLRYLRDRDILSDRKLSEWKIQPETIFSNQHLTVEALEKLITHVDDWLNGSIFPFSFSQVRQKHLREVAGVFLGNDATTQQLHLDFQAYDFSHIPVETLSVIYEQFLRIEGKDKDSGAFYTPLTVVNFMLGELDAIRPLKTGMKVLDPSCGSGAFLVQCYRRLAEAHVQEAKGKPRPAVLRDLLEQHIFGVDRDPDACRVAQLSLVLTMLDYIDPPDLTSVTSRFKLPELHNRNIFEADFFDNSSTVEQTAAPKYSWIVGNPPWTQISSSNPGDFRLALEWVTKNRAERPAVNNEAAEAFAWRAADFCAPGAVIALLLPAMTLFKTTAHFRTRFFRDMTVFSVANFSNLREVLFAGRARMPAAAIFYAPRQPRASDIDTLVYSPLVVNQEANRPEPSRRKETWTILLNSSEVRRISVDDVASGNTLPWKLALWGSHRDGRLLDSLQARFESLGDFISSRGLIATQGLELRERRANEDVEAVPELAGKPELDMDGLRRSGRIHSFPKEVLRPIEPNRAYVRRGRGKLPLAVSKPPHVIVAADRRFAVYSDKFIAVPARQIGIAGKAASKEDLKLLALYLSSSFCMYHEFFLSPQLGIRHAVGTLDVLQKLPTPIGQLSASARREWLRLHDQLATSEPKVAPDFQEIFLGAGAIDRSESESSTEEQTQIDGLVGDALGLSEEEQILVEDLVRLRLPLVDGKVSGPAIESPKPSELRAYVKTLENALDAFTSDAADARHRVTAVMASDVGGVAEILLGEPNERRRAAPVREARGEEEVRLKKVFAQLSQRHSQWLYFDRNLLVHVDDRSYLLKPAQLLWWSRSQALNDADELIGSFLDSANS